MIINPRLEILFATMIFALSGIFARWADLPATTFSFFRMLVPTVLIIIYFIIKEKKFYTGNRKIMFSSSLLNAIRMYLIFYAIMEIPIATAVIIFYSWPIFTAVLGRLFFGEKILRRNWYLLFLAFLGVIVVYYNVEFSFSNKLFVGMCSALLSAFLYSISMLLIKKESHKHSKTEIMLYHNTLGVVIFLPFVIFTKPFPMFSQIAVVGTFGLIGGFFAFMLFFSALKKMDASAASHITYLEVLFQGIWGWLILSEIPTLNVIIGGVLILTSIMFVKK